MPKIRKVVEAKSGVVTRRGKNKATLTQSWVCRLECRHIVTRERDTEPERLKCPKCY